ncbi:hypothetical protein [Terrabacter carboxydivorans]
MSKQRVPDVENFVPEDTSLHGLTQISMDCHRMLAAFVAEYQHQPGAEHFEAFSGYLRGPDIEAWVRDWIVLEPWDAKDRSDDPVD